MDCNAGLLYKELSAHVEQLKILDQKLEKKATKLETQLKEDAKKKHKSYIEALKIGDDVVTDSGIYGRVTNIKEESITLVLKKGEIEILKSKILHK